jgi:hypothetical protein
MLRYTVHLPVAAIASAFPRKVLGYRVLGIGLRNAANPSPNTQHLRWKRTRQSSLLSRLILALSKCIAVG